MRKYYMEVLKWEDGAVEEYEIDVHNDAAAIERGQDEFEFFPQIVEYCIYNENNELVFKAVR